MVTSMLDARNEGATYQRVEVITGQQRRRRRTAEEKARIVGEVVAVLKHSDFKIVDEVVSPSWLLADSDTFGRQFAFDGPLNLDEFVDPAQGAG